MKKICFMLLLAVIGNINAADNKEKKGSESSGTTGLILKIGRGVIEANKGKLCFAAGAIAGATGATLYQNQKEIQKNCSIQ